jgi:hypothetical protein
MPTMTNAYASTQGRSLASTLDVNVAGLLDRLGTAWTQHRAYRATLADLQLNHRRLKKESMLQ